VSSTNLYAAQSPNQISVEAVDCPAAIYAGTTSDVITVAMPKDLVVKDIPTIGPPKDVWYLHQPALTVQGGQLIIADSGLHVPKVPFNTCTYSATYSITSMAVLLSEPLKDVYDALDAWKATHSPLQIYKGPSVITATIHYSEQINYSNLQSLTLKAGPEVTKIQVGDNGSVRGLSVPLTVKGQGANTSVVVDDSQSVLLDVLTIANGMSGDLQMGMAATDQFFGAGGSLDCSGIGSLTVNLSKAANGIVHLSPSTTTAFTINGDPLEYQLGAGAELDVVLGGITDAQLTRGAPGAGTWGFSPNSHQPITFTNVKKTQPQ
jgi:hypothetical protein